MDESTVHSEYNYTISVNDDHFPFQPNPRQVGTLTCITRIKNLESILKWQNTILGKTKEKSDAQAPPLASITQNLKIQNVNLKLGKNRNKNLEFSTKIQKLRVLDGDGVNAFWFSWRSSKFILVLAEMEQMHSIFAREWG